MSAVIVLPESVARELRRKASEAGTSIEGYIVEIALESLDPQDRAARYAEVAAELLERAKEELARGELRQAGEKIWGAVALAVKAHAYAKTGRRLASHRELWEYSEEIAKELGRWVIVAFQQASSMHVNFYEGWATRGHVEAALESAEKLVKAIAESIGRA